MDQRMIELDTRLRTQALKQFVEPLFLSILQIEQGFQPDGKSEPPRECLKQVQEKSIYLSNVTVQLLQTNEKYLSQRSYKAIKNALDNLNKSGNDFLQVGAVFVENTSNLKVRKELSHVAKEVLMAIAELLMAADNVEVQKILDKVDTISRVLENAQRAPTYETFVQTTSKLVFDIQELTEMTRRRLVDSKKKDDKDNLQASLGLLHSSIPLMNSSAINALNNPNDPSAAANKDYAFKSMLNGLNGIKSVLEGQSPNSKVNLSQHSKIDDLIGKLDQFRSSVVIEPNQYRRHEHRPKLEELLETIAVLSAGIADEPRTRPKRRVDVVNGVNFLRQALQDLLHEYEAHLKEKPADDIFAATVHLDNQLKDLRRHLRRAIVDQVSDTFCMLDTPLNQLVESALQGDRQLTQEYAGIFKAFADDIFNVANLVCKMSPDPEGVGMLKYSAILLNDLTPQVINAAIVVSLQQDRSENNPAVQNLHEYKQLWKNRADALRMALDSLISMDDMLAVTEQHILDDYSHGTHSIQIVDAEMLDRVVGTIRGRCVRVTDMVDHGIQDLPASPYTENLRRATTHLRQSIPQFEDKASDLWRKVQDLANNQNEMDPDEFKEEKEKCFDEMLVISDHIHNAVRNIRHALLMNRHPDDVDSDNEYEEDGGTTTVADQRSQISDGDQENQQKILRHLPQAQKAEINKQISMFQIQRHNFDLEMNKWDENGNDIVALAKLIAKILNEMMMFTRGQGPFKTTADVINAAAEVSNLGQQLRNTADSIASECVESTTKEDLCGEISKNIMLCHQLKLTSKVKAEIRIVENEAEVSGLESILSLITNVRNIYQCVVKIVKYASIASTKYRNRTVVEFRKSTQPAVTYTSEPNYTRSASHIVRRRSDRRALPPWREMGRLHI